MRRRRRRPCRARAARRERRLASPSEARERGHERVALLLARPRVIELLGTGGWHDTLRAGELGDRALRPELVGVDAQRKLAPARDLLEVRLAALRLSLRSLTSLGDPLI